MQLGHRVAPELGDRPGARARLFVGEVRPQDLGLDDDQAEGVCDHVVELAGDTNALLGDGSLGLERLLPLLEGGPLARALTANPGVEAQPGRGDRADQHGRQAVVTGRTPRDALQHERRDDADRGDRRVAPTERDRDRVQRHQRRAEQEQDRRRRDDRGNDREQRHQGLPVAQRQRRHGDRDRACVHQPAGGRAVQRRRDHCDMRVRGVVHHEHGDDPEQAERETRIDLHRPLMSKASRQASGPDLLHAPTIRADLPACLIRPARTAAPSG